MLIDCFRFSVFMGFISLVPRPSSKEERRVAVLKGVLKEGLGARLVFHMPNGFVYYILDSK